MLVVKIKSEYTKEQGTLLSEKLNEYLESLGFDIFVGVETIDKISLIVDWSYFKEKEKIIKEIVDFLNCFNLRYDIEFIES